MASAVRGFVPALHSVTQRLHRRSPRPEMLDVDDQSMRHTVDLTSALAFGDDANAVDGDGDRIQHHQTATLPAPMKCALLPGPLWHWLELPADRCFEQDLAAVHALVGEAIEAAR
jgi:hypothetical protein